MKLITIITAATILSNNGFFMAADKGGATGGKGNKKESADDESDSPLRSEYVADNADSEWDEIDGQEYGGTSEILDLKVGEMAKDITYMGPVTSTIGEKEMNVHTGHTKEGSNLRLPIAASFNRAMDQAGVMVGDVIAIRRYDDAKKKSGVGKGQEMAIYAIKIVKKAAGN